MKHGMVGTKFYNCYNGLKDRCNNINSKRYKNYGGRGIKCEWNSFEEFKNDMYDSFIKHQKDNGLRNTSIDRIDVNGNYCKENCRWATLQEQALNKTNTIIYKGLSLSDFCKKNNIDYKIVIQRKNILGWTIEEAIIGKEKFKNLKKKIIKCDLLGKELEVFESISKANKETGVGLGGIALCLNKTHKQAGGFTWKYYTE